MKIRSILGAALLALLLVPAGTPCAAEASSPVLGYFAGLEDATESELEKNDELLGSIDDDVDAVYDKALTKLKWNKNYTEEDLKYLACVIYCETEPLGHDARAALGNIVLNRMNDSSDWGHVNTIYEVIYDTKWSRQFDCTKGSNSMMDKAMKIYDSLSGESTYKQWQITAMTECIQVAKEVMCGLKVVPDDFVFCRGEKYLSEDLADCLEKHCQYIVLESHHYFSNTAAY